MGKLYDAIRIARLILKGKIVGESNAPMNQGDKKARRNIDIEYLINK